MNSIHDELAHGFIVNVACSNAFRITFTIILPYKPRAQSVKCCNRASDEILECFYILERHVREAVRAK